MTQTIHQQVVLSAAPMDVYDALVDSSRHAAFTGGRAKISAEAGGSFSCYDDQIEGRQIDLVPGERIVQAWRVAAWAPGTFSLVHLTLEPHGEKTRVTLAHDGVPEAMREHIDGGWHKRYWEPLENYLAG